jgi:MoaA/NifB/PqqE/SkfB family radical SAM enzyme/orotate phosphoribosyltransferase
MAMQFDSELLRQLCIEYLVQRDEPWQFGFEGDVQMTTFINLMAAAHVDSKLDAMSELMVNSIRSSVSGESYCIVGPKRGNVLLQREVARRLKKTSAFVLDSPLFGRWIEGMTSPDTEALLIDDVASESDILVTSIERLRERGHRVRHAFVLINRVEGDAEDVLARHGVQLHYLLSLSDDDLRIMATPVPTDVPVSRVDATGSVRVADSPKSIDLSTENEPGLSSPPAIDWWITSKCNLSCDFCFGPEPDVREDASLRTRIVDALVESRAPRVTLTGGEPLVVASLPSFVDRLARSGKNIILNTNGELLTERRADQLKIGENVQCVAISIDGGSSEIHRLMRGSNARFNRTVSAAHLAKQRGASLKLATVISAVNVDTMPQLVNLVAELEPTVWRLLQYSHRTQGVSAQRHDFSTGQFNEAVELARQLLPTTIPVASATEEELCGCFTLSEKGDVLVPQVGGYELLGSCFDESIDDLWRRAPNNDKVKRNKRWHIVLNASANH